MSDSEGDNVVTSFTELGLSDWVVDTAKQMGIRRPTEIQTTCIPRILKGEDVVGRAKTGSGKTAAFALPILEKLSHDPFGVFAIVLTPTRELAYQIADQFRAFGVPIGLKDSVIIGGIDMMLQSKELINRPHVIIATPGRLADHIRSGCDIHLEHLQFLVLDEVDRLFDPCFAPDLQTILDAIPPPEDRQTLLFSATLNDSIEAFQQLSMVKPVLCEVSSSSFDTVDKLEQRYLFVPQNTKEVYLAHILKQRLEGGDSIIIFCSTCRGRSTPFLLSFPFSLSLFFFLFLLFSFSLSIFVSFVSLYLPCRFIYIYIRVSLSFPFLSSFARLTPPPPFTLFPSRL